jgi:hypothetical protein
VVSGEWVGGELDGFRGQSDADNIMTSGYRIPDLRLLLEIWT